MSKFLNLVGKFNYLLEAEDQETQVGDDLQKAVETPAPKEQPSPTPQDSQSALPQLSPEQFRTLGKFALIYLKKNKDNFDPTNYPEMINLLNNNTDDAVLNNLKKFLEILPSSKVVKDQDPLTEE